MRRRPIRELPTRKDPSGLIEELTEIGVEFELSLRQPGRFWLADFVRSRSKGQPIREETLAWLERRFARILAGQAPDLALDIKKPRGRPLDPEKVRDEINAADLLLDLYASGRTREQCIAVVCDEYGFPEWLAVDAWERRITPLQLLGRRRKPAKKQK